MNKRIQIRNYKAELKEVETQELLLKQTINAITRRKLVLKSALEELGTSSAPLGEKPKRHLSSKDVYNIKANMIKKAPRQRG